MVRHLSEQEMMPALRTALDIEGATLEILEISNQPVPPGRLEFQRTFLSRPPVNAPQTPVIWRGKLIYDDQRSLMVWARVRISVDHDLFLAKETIPKGAVIRADQVAIDHIRQFPSTELTSNSFFTIVGKIARRTLPAGQPIVAGALDDLKDVFRGERVHVQATDGGASIRFDAIAQSSGQKGEVILVHNPWSGKNFRALIEGRQHVLVRGEL
jgi:flagella basal body P-ring formation protein FlgA